MNANRLLIIIILTGFFSLIHSQNPPVGFQNALWGMSPAEVQKSANLTSFQSTPVGGLFPEGFPILAYTSSSSVAGYKADIKYYFYDNKFIQTTITFNFDELKSFDFNYNVFISVDRYYRAIHDKTVTFVSDIYDLLQKKYGKKQPVFKGLDPRYVFKYTDAYLKQELWNLRYHPSEYYKRIVSAAYARWDFPKTRITFSINISAKDKRFDYQLSLTSLDLEREVNKAKDNLRMKNL